MPSVTDSKTAGTWPRTKAEAVLWHWRAAKQGDAYAQFKLGEAFDLGRGVWPDRTFAVKWYREAARQRNQDARNALRRLTRFARPSDAWPPNAFGDWELDPYPVILRQHPLTNDGDRDSQRKRRWTAEIIGWRVFRGTGSCEEDAYLDLKKRFLAHRDAGNTLPAPVTDELKR
jgi:TPR repeat protein